MARAASAGLKMLNPSPPKSPLTRTTAATAPIARHPERQRRGKNQRQQDPRDRRAAVPDRDRFPDDSLKSGFRKDRHERREDDEEQGLETEEIGRRRDGEKERKYHPPHDALRIVVCPDMGGNGGFEVHWHTAFLSCNSLLATLKYWTRKIRAGQTYAQQPHSMQSATWYSSTRSQFLSFAKFAR